LPIDDLLTPSKHRREAIYGICKAKEVKSALAQYSDVMDFWLNPGAAVFDEALKRFRENQGNIDEARRAARYLNDWFGQNPVDNLVQIYKKQEEQADSYCGVSFKDAVGWDLGGLTALYWFLGRQVHVPGVVKRLMTKLRGLLVLYHDNKEGLDRCV
jgi:hypothetical protein